MRRPRKPELRPGGVANTQQSGYGDTRLVSVQRPTKRSIFGPTAPPLKIGSDRTWDDEANQNWPAVHAYGDLCRGQRTLIVLDRNRGIGRKEWQGLTLLIGDCKSPFDQMDYFNPGIPVSVDAIPF
jgi:hypothetical protein